MGARDESWNISHHERFVVVHGHYAEVRLEGRERIIRDLGPRRGNARNQRGLADVGKADQTDVGEQFQLQSEVLLLASHAILRLLRHTIHRRRKVRIAVSAASAFCNQDALADLREVMEDLPSFLIVDHCAKRDGDLGVFTVPSVAIASFSMTSTPRTKYVVEAESEESVFVGIGNQVN